MIVPITNPDNGESNIIWTGERDDLEVACSFLFGDGEPCAIPFNPETGQLVVNGSTVNRGDMLHKDAAGGIRVLVPVGVTVGPR